jgi:hypothetical protein
MQISSTTRQGLVTKFLSEPKAKEKFTDKTDVKDVFERQDKVMWEGVRGGAAILGGVGFLGTAVMLEAVGIAASLTRSPVTDAGPIIMLGVGLAGAVIGGVVGGMISVSDFKKNEDARP